MRQEPTNLATPGVSLTVPEAVASPGLVVARDSDSDGVPGPRPVSPLDAPVGADLVATSEAPPPAPKVITGWDVIPWLLTAAGIFASLAWNYFNYDRMKRFQRDLRQETVRLEEFRRIRTPIDAALVELRPLRETLRGLAVSALDLETIRIEAEEAQKALTERFLVLQGALDGANASHFAEGTDWLEPVDQMWDQIVNTFDIVHSVKRNETEARAALQNGATKLTEVSRIVTARIDRELKRYTDGTKI